MMQPLAAEQQLDVPYRPNLNVTVICRNCKKTPANIVDDPSGGNVICGDCGLVLSDHIIDERSEWRTFANDDQNGDDPSRVGGVTNELNPYEEATSIGFDKNAPGKFRDLMRAQRSQKERTHTNLTQGYRDIDTFANNMGLEKAAIETAKWYFKLVEDNKALRGKAHVDIIATCIFLSCRRNKIARTFREITEQTGATKKAIGRIFKQLEELAKLSADKKALLVQRAGGAAADAVSSYDRTKHTEASDLIVRHTAGLGLPAKVTKVCTAMARKVTALGTLAGRSPISIASACIYMGCHLMGEPRDAKAIGVRAGVSESTIKGAYKTLFAIREALIDPAWGGDGGALPAG